MLIKPKFEEKLSGVYAFGAKTNANAHACLHTSIFQEFWKGFCCEKGEIAFKQEENFVFKVGEASTVNTPSDGYAMEITEKGISIVASDERNLTYGFFALLERIRPICTDFGKEKFTVSCCRVEDNADIKVRMVHLCIFPETTLTFMRKLIRAIAFLRYTHVVIEFWGTIQLDCLKELAWKEAFTKDDIRPIIKEARALGLEIIPMFNHWGHATASRVMTGKHVVLDQNLALAPLFSSSGWEWDLENPNVIELLGNIRKELIELCGDGEYFHIGCDEAYSAQCEKDFEIVVNYINVVAADLEKQGRKTIIWGDMLLHEATLVQNTQNDYNLLCPSEKLQKNILDKLSRSIIIGDWEYSAKHTPIETALFFKEKGFEVLCCPWDRSKENVIASANTVKENNLLGVMHTTWHTIARLGGMWSLAYSAALAWGETVFNSAHVAYQGNELMAIMRKLCCPNGEYEDSGLTTKQVLYDLP